MIDFNLSALDAIKLGGLKGQGMGEGILKDSYQEAHTDYIIAIISEEFGSIVSIMIILIFLYISFRIIKNYINQEDELTKISLCGLSALLIFQTFIHVSKYKLNTDNRNDITFLLWWLLFNRQRILAGIILNYTKNRTYLYE